MIINITKQTTVREVQRRLRTAYPFLKIEFFCNSHCRAKRLHKSNWLDPDCRLLEAAIKQMPGWIVVHSWYKSGFIREAFVNRFGLPVQIFRKNNDEWIEIGGTDVFTLEEQNEIGRRTVEKHHTHSWRERELLL